MQKKIRLELKGNIAYNTILLIILSMYCICYQKCIKPKNCLQIGECIQRHVNLETVYN